MRKKERSGNAIRRLTKISTKIVLLDSEGGERGRGRRRRRRKRKGSGEKEEGEVKEGEISGETVSTEAPHAW